MTPLDDKTDSHMVLIEKLVTAQWTAVYTKPRCEKVVNEYCRRHSIACYVPLRRRAKRYQRRTVETFLPMFSGYVFVQLHPEMKTILLESHKVVTVLQIEDTQEDLLIHELNQLQQLEQLQLEEDLIVQPKLIPGTPVQVVVGPLAGLTGIVQHRKNKARVSINVEILGQSVSAELDLGEVELVTE